MSAAARIPHRRITFHRAGFPFTPERVSPLSRSLARRRLRSAAVRDIYMYAYVQVYSLRPRRNLYDNDFQPFSCPPGRNNGGNEARRRRRISVDHALSTLSIRRGKKTREKSARRSSFLAVPTLAVARE